jgi:hypothetical protein
MRNTSVPSVPRFHVPLTSSRPIGAAARRLGLDSRAALLRDELADLRALDAAEAFGPDATAARLVGRPQSVVVAASRAVRR